MQATGGTSGAVGLESTARSKCASTLRADPRRSGSAESRTCSDRMVIAVCACLPVIAAINVMAAEIGPSMAWVCARTPGSRFFLGRSLWFSVSWLREESEPTEQSVRCADHAFGEFDSVLSFLSRGGVCGETRILQLVPSAPQVSEWPETRAELGPDRTFHRVVTTVGGGTHALLRQQRNTGEPRGVVGQDVSAVGVGLNQALSRGCRLSCLGEQRGTAGCCPSHVFQLPLADELLYLGLACLPSSHRLPSPLLESHRLRRLARGSLRKGQTESAGLKGRSRCAMPLPSGSRDCRASPVAAGHGQPSRRPTF